MPELRSRLPARVRRVRRPAAGVRRRAGAVRALLLALGVVGLAAAQEPAAPEPPPAASRGAASAPEAGGAAAGPVVAVRIEGEIGRGLAAYVRRALRRAEEQGARLVVLRVNTPGGRLDAALAIKDALLDSRVPTAALVERQAFSAGALISIAATRIYAEEGAAIGAATPVLGGSGEQAGEKVVSAVRKAFAATAERRGRDPQVAEAMVDASVAIPGLVEEGKLLTLTAREAREAGYVDAVVDGLDALLAREGLSEARVVETAPSPAERLAGWLTSPAVASLLMSLGFLGLVLELQTAGWGVGGMVGIVCLGLFFWGHFLAGLAGWESVVLVAAGVLLMLIEMLVVPGFGIPGGLGIASFLAGLYLALVGDPGTATAPTLWRAAYMLAASVLLMILGAWLLLRHFPGTRPFGGRLVLRDSLERTSAPKLEPESELESDRPAVEVGARGTALTDLRPAGTADFDGEPVDVVTESRFVGAGTPVVLVSRRGYRKVVRPAPEAAPEAEPGVREEEA